MAPRDPGFFVYRHRFFPYPWLRTAHHVEHPMIFAIRCPGVSIENYTDLHNAYVLCMFLYILYIYIYLCVSSFLVGSFHPLKNGNVIGDHHPIPMVKEQICWTTNQIIIGSVPSIFPFSMLTSPYFQPAS